MFQTQNKDITPRLWASVLLQSPHTFSSCTVDTAFADLSQQSNGNNCVHKRTKGDIKNTGKKQQKLEIYNGNQSGMKAKGLIIIGSKCLITN